MTIARPTPTLNMIKKSESTSWGQVASSHILKLGSRHVFSAALRQLARGALRNGRRICFPSSEANDLMTLGSINLPTDHAGLSELLEMDFRRRNLEWPTGLSSWNLRSLGRTVTGPLIHLGLSRGVPLAPLRPSGQPPVQLFPFTARGAYSRLSDQYPFIFTAGIFTSPTPC